MDIKLTILIVIVLRSYSFLIVECNKQSFVTFISFTLLAVLTKPLLLQEGSLGRCSRMGCVGVDEDDVRSSSDQAAKSVRRRMRNRRGGGGVWETLHI